MKKPEPAAIIKDVLTPEELSARWGGEVLPGTLAQWRVTKMGPKYVKLGGKHGKKIVYRLSAVQQYERENEIAPRERRN